MDEFLPVKITHSSDQNKLFLTKKHHVQVTEVLREIEIIIYTHLKMGKIGREMALVAGAVIFKRIIFACGTKRASFTN